MTATATSSLLINPPNEKHIVLIYDDPDVLDASIADYINEGLKRDQFCVYATIHVRDDGHTDKFRSLITDYDENVKKGNLLIADLAPFYISALIGDMKPFEDAKKLFAEKANERADKHVRFVGDGTGFLFRNRHFDECAMVEQWWGDRPFHGSYVCPFEREFLESHPYNIYANHTVMATHDVVIDISQRPLKNELYRHQQQLAMAENEGAGGKGEISSGAEK